MTVLKRYIGYKIKEGLRTLGALERLGTGRSRSQNKNAISTVLLTSNRRWIFKNLNAFSILRVQLYS
jgi:hypothetical protein